MGRIQPAHSSPSLSAHARGPPQPARPISTRPPALLSPPPSDRHRTASSSTTPPRLFHRPIAIGRSRTFLLPAPFFLAKPPSWPPFTPAGALPPPRFPPRLHAHSRALISPRYAASAPVRFPFSRARDCRIANGRDIAAAITSRTISTSRPPPPLYKCAPGAPSPPQLTATNLSLPLAVVSPDFAGEELRPSFSPPPLAPPSPPPRPRLRHQRLRRLHAHPVLTSPSPERHRSPSPPSTRSSPPPLSSPPAVAAASGDHLVSARIPASPSLYSWSHRSPPCRVAPASSRPSRRRLRSDVALPPWRHLGATSAQKPTWLLAWRPPRLATATSAPPLSLQHPWA